MPVHTPHGMEPKQKINVPAFYLLNQYLKSKATELFEVAYRDNLPVLQTGRYQNLTHNINVSCFYLCSNFLKLDKKGRVLDRFEPWAWRLRRVDPVGNGRHVEADGLSDWSRVGGD